MSSEQTDTCLFDTLVGAVTQAFDEKAEWEARKAEAKERIEALEDTLEWRIRHHRHTRGRLHRTL